MLNIDRKTTAVIYKKGRLYQFCKAPWISAIITAIKVIPVAVTVKFSLEFFFLYNSSEGVF